MRRLLYTALLVSGHVTRALARATTASAHVTASLTEILEGPTPSLHDLWMANLNDELDEEARTSCAE